MFSVSIVQICWHILKTQYWISSIFNFHLQIDFSWMFNHIIINFFTVGAMMIVFGINFVDPLEGEAINNWMLCTLCKCILCFPTPLKQVWQSCKTQMPAMPAFSYWAEREGFEPSKDFWPLHTFQACQFNHSCTSPKGCASYNYYRNLAIWKIPLPLPRFYVYRSIKI